MMNICIKLNCCRLSKLLVALITRIHHEIPSLGTGTDLFNMEYKSFFFVK